MANQNKKKRNSSLSKIKNHYGDHTFKLVKDFSKTKRQICQLRNFPFLYFLDFNQDHWWGFQSEPKRLFESTSSLMYHKTNFSNKSRKRLFFHRKISNSLNLKINIIFRKIKGYFFQFENNLKQLIITWLKRVEWNI